MFIPLAPQRIINEAYVAMLETLLRRVKARHSLIADAQLICDIETALEPDAAEAVPEECPAHPGMGHVWKFVQGKVGTDSSGADLIAAYIQCRRCYKLKAADLDLEKVK
jgi:hypothetical protein